MFITNEKTSEKLNDFQRIFDEKAAEPRVKASSSHSKWSFRRPWWNSPAKSPLCALCVICFQSFRHSWRELQPSPPYPELQTQIPCLLNIFLPLVVCSTGFSHSSCPKPNWLPKKTSSCAPCSGSWTCSLPTWRCRSPHPLFTPRSQLAQACCSNSQWVFSQTPCRHGLRRAFVSCLYHCYKPRNSSSFFR